MKRSIAWGIGISVAVAALAGACGSSVSDTSGSGGGTGGNGSPASSSKATTGGMGGSGGTMGTGGSGMGGGDACSMACTHAAQCGEDLCSQFQLDCSMQQGTCLAACINAANCQEIMDAASNPMDPSNPLILCALPCLQGGTGGGGQGGNGAGGGSGMACEQCAGNACSQEIQTCGGDMSMNGCAAWLQCAIGCNFDPTCTAACDTQYAAVASEYDPIYACACTNCMSECSGVDPCGMHPAMGGTGGAPN